ncbi:MAG: hypothetical protein AAF289_01820 [Cyanobacteria bacterium P01_A01_bin.135]
MQIERKPIRSGERRVRLCLVISLGNGAKAQYPVADADEARVLYEEHLRLNTAALVPQA